jgi:hypothetical protein
LVFAVFILLWLEGGTMPPHGGNPELTDEEVRAAVIYMMEQARWERKGSDLSEEGRQDDYGLSLAG